MKMKEQKLKKVTIKEKQMKLRPRYAPRELPRDYPRELHNLT